MRETFSWFLFRLFCKLKPFPQFLMESQKLEISVGSIHGLGGETGRGQKNWGWGGDLHRVRKKTGKGRCEHLLFPRSLFPQLRRQIYSTGLGRGVSMRKTDLQFCPLRVWVLSFNSPISINPHLAAHPSSDISSFPSL